MAYRKKTSVRRAPRRRRKRNYNQVNSSRPPIGKSYSTKLVYVDNFSVDPSSILPSFHVMRANSLFDPNESATGHQPLGFDELSQLYEKYCVTGSKITATFFSESSTPQTGNQVAYITLDNTTTVPGDTTSLLEAASTVSRPIGPTTGSQDLVKLSKTFSARQWFSVKDPLDKDDLTALIAANPAQQAYFKVGTTPLNPLDNPGAVQVQVRMEFRVHFTSPRSLGQS